MRYYTDVLWCQTRIQSLEFFLFQVFTALEWVLSELQFVVEQALCHFHRQFYGLQYKVGHFFRFYEYHLLTDFIKKKVEIEGDQTPKIYSVYILNSTLENNFLGLC